MLIILYTSFLCSSKFIAGMYYIDNNQTSLMLHNREGHLIKILNSYLNKGEK